MTSQPRVHVGSRADLAAELAREVTAFAVAGVAASGRFTIALSGGSVARAFCPALGSAPIPWQHVHVFWCDERAVPPADPESNFGLVQRLWAGTPALNDATLHPMHGAAQDLEAEAARYAAELEAECGRPPALDVVLLGVGEDGHIASLFPGHGGAELHGPSVIAVTDAPKMPARRLTLAFDTIARARVVIVGAFGLAKAAVIRDAVELRASGTPAARVVGAAADVRVFLDRDAASALSR